MDEQEPTNGEFIGGCLIVLVLAVVAFFAVFFGGLRVHMTGVTSDGKPVFTYSSDND